LVCTGAQDSTKELGIGIRKDMEGGGHLGKVEVGSIAKEMKGVSFDLKKKSFTAHVQVEESRRKGWGGGNGGPRGTLLVGIRKGSRLISWISVRGSNMFNKSLQACG